MGESAHACGWKLRYTTPSGARGDSLPSCRKILKKASMTDTQGTDSLQQAIAALQGSIPGQARAILESLTAQGADTAAVWGVLALACRDQEDMPAALEGDKN